MKTVISIRNANSEDFDYLTSLKKPSENMGEAFATLVSMAKTSISTEIKDENSEVNALQTENKIKLIREDCELQLDQLNTTIVLQNKQILELIQKNEVLLNQEPEIKTVEIVKTIPVELSGFQFICELDEQTSRNARKIRSFVKKEGFYDPQPDETPAQYINALTNLSVKSFIKRHFADYI